MFNESKENFKIVFSCSSVITGMFVPLLSSNFPMKLPCWGIVVFVCLDKSMPISL